MKPLFYTVFIIINIIIICHKYWSSSQQSLLNIVYTIVRSTIFAYIASSFCFLLNTTDFYVINQMITFRVLKLWFRDFQNSLEIWQLHHAYYNLNAFANTQWNIHYWTCSFFSNIYYFLVLIAGYCVQHFLLWFLKRILGLSFSNLMSFITNQ